MEYSEFKKLVTKGEGKQLDFKRNLRTEDMRELSKDIAGFANTEGGQILVGVDNKKNIVGVDWDQDMTAQVYQQGVNCTPSVAVAVEEISAPPKVGTVVIITVPKTGAIHMDSTKKFPQRINDSTMPMDAMTILARAKELGLIAGEQTFLNQQSYTRSKPKKVAFLLDYLSDKNPFIRIQAVSDIGGLTFRYAVEEIPGLSDKLLHLLDDEVMDVQIATLNALGNLNYRLDKKLREKYRKSFGQKFIELSTGKGQVNLRSRALQSLFEFGDPKGIDIIIDLAKSEPAETYGAFNLQNHFMRIAEAGLGYALKERLLKEMSTAEKPEEQERLKNLLVKTGEINWAT